MSKIFSKTVKKTTLTSVIIAVILAASVVVCALFGFNKSVLLDDYNTVTVSVNTFAYKNSKDKITATCESEFKKAGVEAELILNGEKGGDDCEIVFVFDKDVKVEDLKASLSATLQSTYANATIDVSAAHEVAESVVAKHFVLRAAIAGVVLAVLAFAYVAVRFKKITVGAVVGGNALLAMLLTAGVISLVRVPVTTSVATVIVTAGLLTVVSVMLTAGKIRGVQKEGTELSNEELVVSSIAWKETVALFGLLAIGMVLVGALGKTDGLWFAVSALIGIILSAAISLFFAPATYLSLKTVADGKVKKDYVGAKKTSKKQKKARPVAKEAPVEEAPVEETVEEAPVEETVEEAPVEETVEETPVEETVEEAPVEE